MKKLLFILLSVVLLSSCSDTFQEVKSDTAVSYVATEIINNTPEVMDTVQLLELENYYYIVQDNKITYKVEKEIPLGGFFVLGFCCAMFVGSIIFSIFD